MAISNYTATTTSGIALVANKRLSLIICNTGSNPVFLNFGATAEVNKGIYLAANGGTYNMDLYLQTEESINAITGTGTSILSIYYILWA